MPLMTPWHLLTILMAHHLEPSPVIRFLWHLWHKLNLPPPSPIQPHCPLACVLPSIRRTCPLVSLALCVSLSLPLPGVFGQCASSPRGYPLLFVLLSISPTASLVPASSPARLLAPLLHPLAARSPLLLSPFPSRLPDRCFCPNPLDSPLFHALRRKRLEVILQHVRDRMLDCAAAGADACPPQAARKRFDVSERALSCAYVHMRTSREHPHLLSS